MDNRYNENDPDAGHDQDAEHDPDGDLSQHGDSYDPDYENHSDYGLLFHHADL